MEHITAANVKTAYELEHKHDADETRLEKIVDRVASFSGTVAFIIWHLVIFTLWILYNVLMPKSFDPYPFTLLLMVVSLESILLSTIVLINQTKSGEKQDRRHKLDLQVNMLAEQENTMMLRVLDKICAKLGVDSSELADYLDDTAPEEVLEQIEKVDKGVMT